MFLIGCIFLFFYKVAFNFSLSDNLYIHGPRDVNKISLTFDDGPSNETMEIIEALKMYNVSATFFVVGKQVEKYPEEFLALTKTNNEIEDHTYDHAKLNMHFNRFVRNEINMNNEALSKFNITPSLMRPPYGFLNCFTNAPIEQANESVVLWDLNSRDYTQASANTIVQNVLKNVQNGSIILFHDSAYGIGNTNTPEALRKLIPILQKKYKIVPVSELLDFKDPKDDGIIY